ncbi:MAG: AbiEi antitoxin N-terminal domain-containing protein [Trueperaceae bacterium]|nr:AbiEi antitoxin N-terminal domain-containing protein [Trueperaceae bacterium]
MPTNAEKVLALARKRGILRTRDLAAQGIPRVTLTRLEQAGLLDRVGRGLYSLPGIDASEHHALVAATRRVPQGIVCLLSALRFHGMTTQQPFEVWMAIDRKARRPAADYPPLRIVRFAGAALDVGIQSHRIEGVPVRVTDPARTVADCFRYRNKIGIDVAIEALRDYRRLRKGSMDALAKAARARRVAGIMRPYLEAMA